MEKFCIGIDFGTDSVRTIIVNTANGEEVASYVYEYPRWRDGLYCDPAKDQYRQHPLDYLEGLELTVKHSLKQAGDIVRENIVAISADTTGSTPVAVDGKGVPLALHPGFSEDPDAMFILWKDHSALQEAVEINAHAKNFSIDYLADCGGIYSSEWFWSKILHTLRINIRVREAAYSWVEHCDWVPFLLTGGGHINQMKRSVCTAGHKALWSGRWGGLPPDDFFSSLDPLLSGITERLYVNTFTADQAAGRLSRLWAEKLGLTTDIVVGVGAMDAHMGAVGGQIEPYHLSKVIGTSTCDMLVIPDYQSELQPVKGICGQVNGSIIPGMIGLEAGQSAFGDVYSWFRNVLLWPLQQELHHSGPEDQGSLRMLHSRLSAMLLPELDRLAADLPPAENSEWGLDWFNGRRTPDTNSSLKGMIAGLSLGSKPPQIYRALVESTCYGAKKIIDRFEEEGIAIRGVTAVGGIARKSPYVMQTLADILDRPVKLHRSEQTCAHGAAMFAATAAGIYPCVEEAMQAMGQGFDKEYRPCHARKEVYQKGFERYAAMGGFAEQILIL